MKPNENIILTQKDITKDTLKEFENRLSGGGIIGIPTGFIRLDDMLNGLQSKLYVIAARPSVGKTAFAMQIANTISRAHPVGVISLEMQPTDIVFRALANRTKIPLSAIQKGEVKALDRLMDAFSEVSKYNIFYSFSAYDIASMAHVVKAMAEQGCKVIVVDHLQLTHAAGNTRNAQLDNALKVFLRARKVFNISIILLSQLSRAVEKDDREPMLSDLRDSGAIEQDADVVIFLHEEGIDEESGAKKVKLIIAKGRNEQTGVIRYNFITKYMFWEELI